MSPAPLRRRRSTFNPFLAVMLGLLGVFGILLTLHFTERIQLPFVDAALGRDVHAKGEELDLVPVIVTARDLKPGEAVERLDVWDLATQGFKVVRLRRESVKDEWILNWGEIEGRVMARAKRKDKAFKQSDFLPEGTRPGVASLVPPGMRMVTIPSDRIGGLEALHYQDRFDLVAHLEVDDKRIDAAKQAVEGLSTNLRLEIEALRGSTSRRTVTRDAMRLPAIESKAKGGKTELAIAVAEGEVPALLQALEGESELFCVVYSGNDVEWSRRTLNVDYDPNRALEEILDRTREVRIREGDDVRTVRVMRYRDPETSPAPAISQGN